MDEPAPSTLAEEFAAALDWWRDAGVDHDFSDDVTDWLAKPKTENAAQAAKPAPKKQAETAAAATPKKIGGARETWPSELAAFQEWFAASNDLDEGGAFPALAPRGDAGAELMIIVPEPEETDSDRILSGTQGRLLKGILQAAGIDNEKVYLGTVLRRHTPMPDWAALDAAGLGDLLMHHINLAAPKRILTFGRNIPPLFGNDTAQGTAILQNIKHEGGSIPAMGVGSLSELLRSAGRRQRFWQRWLEWTDS